ncbi:MAG: hypothetical protein HYR88_00070 [Verrucomicrobia bacterium]|nr:hypothetical protein [Verrucomicrobiota bacterium]MBI3867469.1 hypothetical protein [Verrucomicrobiota bacterium]
MKRLCLSSALVCALAAHAAAEALLSDHFNYADGPIAQDSGSPWITHGGTPNQVDVSQGVLNLTQAESEDVSAPLAGGPYKTGPLYMSCVVNYLALPSGNGTFFWHLKDAASTFKARVYTTTNGVAHGFYRMGIANGAGAPVYVASDLELTRSYRVVVRYSAGAPTQSTLWLNPKAETDADLRVDATDNPTATGITAVALRQSLASGDGMGTLLLDDMIVATTFSDAGGENTPPSVSQIPDQDLPGDRISDPIGFTVDDKETPLDKLRIQAQSTNPSVIPEQSIALKGSGRLRQLVLQPITGRQGAARITLVIGDGEKTASTAFNVTVGAPSITRVDAGSVSFPVNEASPPLAFHVSDRESSSDPLVVTGEAANTQLFPAASFHWEGSGDLRTLRLSPAPDRSGFSLVRVVVSDGTMRATNALVVSVYPQLGLVLSEDFDYPDGPLVAASRPWSFHAPDAPNPTNLVVRGGRLVLSGSNGEDGHRLLNCGLQKSDSGVVFYTGLTFRLTQPPSTAGDFFAHFRDDKSGFRCRLHVASGGASAGRFRLGVSSGSGSPVYHAAPLALQEDHRVVVRYEVSTAECALWLDPLDESAASVHATDDASAIGISNWSFRQASGIGVIEVDDVRVASRFSDVARAAEAPRLMFDRAGESLVLRWAAQQGLVAQRTTRLGPTAWTDIQQSTTHESGMEHVALPFSDGTGFFRLYQK